MSEVIYGRNPVYEALRSHQKIEKILIAEGVSGQKVAGLLRLAKQERVKIETVPKKIVSQMAGTVKNQGVVALVESRKYASLDDILQKSRRVHEPPFLALLDGIEDPHNLGAILRAADGCGVHGVIFPKRRAVGLTPTVAKTSAGALAHVLTAQVSNLNLTIDRLKEQNIWIVGADQGGQKLYYETDLSLPVAIVIGSEGQGLHRLVREKCDFLVKIPMYGKINSLNASMAAALLFYEARRQRTGSN